MGMGLGGGGDDPVCPPPRYVAIVGFRVIMSPGSTVPTALPSVRGFFQMNVSAPGPYALKIVASVKAGRGFVLTLHPQLHAGTAPPKRFCLTFQQHLAAETLPLVCTVDYDIVQPEDTSRPQNAALLQNEEPRVTDQLAAWQSGDERFADGV